MSENTITWLHLSDLHTCMPKTGWDSDRVLDTLENDLASMERLYGLHPDFIFFTGDAAFGHLDSQQGMNIVDQFKDAENFFSRVRKSFSSPVPKSRFFIVPGNHDVDRSMVTDDQIHWLVTKGTRDEVISMIHQGNRQWQRAMERLSPYKEFLENEGYSHLLNDPKRLVFSNKLNLAGITVGIAGFNSAWSCSRDKEKGALWLGGEWQVANLRRELGNVQLSIALMHHPSNWFVEQEDPTVGRKIERDFTFFLHGHEHQGWVDAKADGHVRIASAACYDRSDKENGYNFVRINVDRKEAEIFLRQFDSNGGGWIERNIHEKTKQGVWTLQNLRIANTENVNSIASPSKSVIITDQQEISNSTLSIVFTFNCLIKDFDTARLLRFLESEVGLDLSKVEITRIWQGSTNLRLEGNAEIVHHIVETLSKDESLLARFSIQTGLTKIAWEEGLNLQTIEINTELPSVVRVKAVDLSSQDFTRIPESLRVFRHIEKLDLSLNHLSELPEWLIELDELRELDLSRNQFSTLPNWLGQLHKLQRLIVRGNRLSDLPATFSELSHLQILDVSDNQIKVLPEWLRNFRKLLNIDISRNQIKRLPEWIGELEQIQNLYASNNRLNSLPDSISQLRNIESLSFSANQLRILPDSIGELQQLQSLSISANQIDFLPASFQNLVHLKHLDLSSNAFKDLPSVLGKLEISQLFLDENPLNLELTDAYKKGKDVLLRFLRESATSPIVLDEIKLIIVGEGEVGKTSLFNALRGDIFNKSSPSTHGIEIKSFNVIHPDTHKEITINGWDFGGQRIYRPTHQLFFSAPAVYLVVWKPREGPQQGFVKEWIQLIKRREPNSKILVVATHGGPQQRQPDIDRQELWDLFGKNTIVDFLFVDSKPDEYGHCKGIAELKTAIARVAATLPEAGRSVPKSFADVRAALQTTGAPYLPLDEVLTICRACNMDDEIARLFITISHRLGHLTHYENDPVLRDIVILRPDWLATAISYVLDDEETRNAHGLVKFSRLRHLWDDPTRPTNSRYPDSLHHIFLRLMERFDISYRVAGISKDEESNPVSLIAQLVPDNNPEESIIEKIWGVEPTQGDIQRTQICRIVDSETGQSANAEGLFYQLIVRLHKYSLGREHYDHSVHWQRGLVLDADYNGRALLRHVGHDVHITVRAPYPERFLAMLTAEVKYLVESFWEGLRCDVTVPCLNPTTCTGLFEVTKLIENKKRNRLEIPCAVCNEWQSIDRLLSNSPIATQSISLDNLLKEFAEVKNSLDSVNNNTSRILSQVDKQYADLIQVFTDEAKEGPRLFSLSPRDNTQFNPKDWNRAIFRLILWCEHSRLPLPVLNEGNMQKGVYDLEFEREWFQKAAPYLKFLTGTLSLVLPVASSTLNVINNNAFKEMENQLGLGKDVIDAIAGTGTAFNEIMGKTDSANFEHGVGIRAENSTLRELHAMLKAKDPSFGGLVRVINKRQEFLWVHEKYASEY